MQVFIKTPEGKTRVIEVTRAETVAQLKSKIAIREGIPADALHLHYRVKPLEDHLLLEHYDIVPNCDIHMSIRLRGGK